MSNMSSIKLGDKLYVIVREDLTPGLQIAQACHAARQFAADHPEIEAEWFSQSNHIVVLSVPSEGFLWDLERKSIERRIAISRFEEPDLDSSLTAIAIEPGLASEKLCSGLKLALS